MHAGVHRQRCLIKGGLAKRLSALISSWTSIISSACTGGRTCCHLQNELCPLLIPPLAKWIVLQLNDGWLMECRCLLRFDSLVVEYVKDDLWPQWDFLPGWEIFKRIEELLSPRFECCEYLYCELSELNDGHHCPVSDCGPPPFAINCGIVTDMRLRVWEWARAAASIEGRPFIAKWDAILSSYYSREYICFAVCLSKTLSSLWLAKIETHVYTCIFKGNCQSLKVLWLFSTYGATIIFDGFPHKKDHCYVSQIVF